MSDLTASAHVAGAMDFETEAKRHAAKKAESLYSASDASRPTGSKSALFKTVLLAILVFFPLMVVTFIYKTWGSDALVLVFLVVLVFLTRSVAQIFIWLISRQGDVHIETLWTDICTWITAAAISTAVQYGFRLVADVWEIVSPTPLQFIVVVLSILFTGFAAIQSSTSQRHVYRSRELALLTKQFPSSRIK